MNQITGKGMFGAFIVSFVIFLLTHNVLVGMAGDIFLIIAVVVTLINFAKSRKRDGSEEG